MTFIYIAAECFECFPSLVPKVGRCPNQLNFFVVVSSLLWALVVANFGGTLNALKPECYRGLKNLRI
jgi:hypothetical protein